MIGAKYINILASTGTGKSEKKRGATQGELHADIDVRFIIPKA